MFKPVDPENAERIERLVSILEWLPIGAVATYDTLSQAAGIDVRGAHVLKVARDRAEKSLGCIYEPERKIGIRRVESAAVPEVGLAAIGRIRRAAKRTNKRLGRVNVNSLAPAETQRLTGYRAMLGAIVLVADGRRAQTVGAVADPAKPIPPKNILAMFSAPGD